ncbi:MAG: hypothetical protein GC179_08725 [Anaerolineaceae bacterium]|nr:hypothetical protein [Anaerolineaceae bacterium]
MPAIEPFTGFYSKALRGILPCLSGQETKLFVAVASYTDEQGKCYPGIRELSDVTTFPEKVVSDLLSDLEAKGLVLTLRKSERDMYTGRMMPDVYIVNPEILLVSDMSLWIQNRLRNAYIPESTFPVKSVQADRITEAESGEPESAKQNHSFDGAAMLPKTNTNTPMATRTLLPTDGAKSTQAGENRPNSAPQGRIPPGSAAPPLTRPLTWQESMAVSAIKRQISDMSHDTAADLIVRYGEEQFTAAVMSYKERSKKIVIKKPTGWIIQNLKMGEKKR